MRLGLGHLKIKKKRFLTKKLFFSSTDFSCDQGGYGGGPMKPRGASGANRSAPYRGGQSGGFRGGRGRGGFRGRQM